MNLTLSTTVSIRNFRVIFLILFFSSNRIHSQVEWLLSAGSTEDDVAYDLDNDQYGHLYTVGTFEGTVDFEMGAGTTNITSAPINDYNGFIKKSSTDGTLEWVKTFSNRCKPTSIEVKQATESSLGYFVVSGTFWGTMNFASGISENASAHDMFVAKYDLDGNYIWHRVYGGDENDKVEDFCIDQDDNIIFHGLFGGTVDFGNGSVYTADFMTKNGVIQKLDKDGVDLMTLRMKADFASGKGIGVDDQGNIYAAGNYFSGPFVLFPSGLSFSLMHQEINNYGTRAFLLKFDSTGAYQWSRVFGSDSTVYVTVTGTKGASGITDLVVDSQGEVILTGGYGRSVTFTPTVTLHDGGIGGKALVYKFDSDGNLKWINAFGGGGTDAGLSLELDEYDNIYSTGFVGGYADLDPTEDSIIVNTGSFKSVFLQKWDSTGTLIDARAFGSSCDHAVGNALTLDENGSAYIAGYFDGYGWTYWEPPYGDIYVQDYGDDDILLFKIEGYDQYLSIEDEIKDNVVRIHPNPSSEFLFLDATDNIVKVEVTNIQNQVVFSDKIQGSKIDIRNWMTGIYFVHVHFVNETIVQKVIKQ